MFRSFDTILTSSLNATARFPFLAAAREIAPARSTRAATWMPERRSPKFQKNNYLLI